jgi:hypothetical protein
VSGRSLPTIFILLFGHVAVVLAGVAAWLAWDTRTFLERAETAEGVVVALSPPRGTSRAVVRFQPPGEPPREILSKVASSPPAYEVGERVTVFYDPQDPDEARLGGMLDLWFLPALFGGLSVPFGGIAFGFWAWGRARERRREHLQRVGVPVSATIVAMDRSSAVKGGRGQRLFIVTAEWAEPATGRIHRARSRPLSVDPSLHYKIGERIQILVDPRDPDRSDMALLKLGPAGEGEW